MTGKVDDSTSSIPAGFLDAQSGRVRSKEELSSADKAAAQKQAEAAKAAQNNSDAAPTDVVSRADKAISSVQQRVNAQVNSIGDQINNQLDNAKEAERVVKEQINTAKDLKQLVKDNGSDKDIAAAQEKLQKLDTQAKAIEKKISADNQAQAPDRIRSVRLGNETKVTIDVKPVEFKATEAPKGLDKPKDIDRFIDQLKDSKESLQTQKKNLRETRNEVRDTARAVREEIKGIKKDTLTTLQDAEKLSNKIADQVRAGGQEVFAANALREANVKDLVTQ